jgi:hypothetical protein
MSKTNTLTSHHPERRTFIAGKFFPEELVKLGYGGKFNKRFHTKKSRSFFKYDLRKELGY